MIIRAMSQKTDECPASRSYCEKLKRRVLAAKMKHCRIVVRVARCATSFSLAENSISVVRVVL